LTAGGALKWFKDLFGEVDSSTYRNLDKEAIEADPGSKGLLFLPYLNGERCPYNDPDARGAFIGLSLQHTKAHMIRSVLEGVAFGLRNISDLIIRLDGAPQNMFLSGGGANSNLWRQIITDIFNVNVITMKNAAYGGAFGAALIAGTSVGIWPSIEEAAKVLAVETQNRPIKKNVDIYDELYQLYHNLYNSLATNFKQIADLKL